jgi:5'-phosphate synthase pdxT subunit
MKFGVLALQGDFREHIAVLNKLKEETIEVKSISDLDEVQALIIPGGESTTMSLLAKSTGLDKAIAERISAGMYVYGSCAGMILLATEILDGRADQICFSALDITVRRNGFGRQVDSFEASLQSKIGTEFSAVFIRAPKVERIGKDVQVLATVEISGNQVPVMVRNQRALATSFHPELLEDGVVHKYFVQMVRGEVS